MGHQAQTRRTARNFLMFHTIAVRLTKYIHCFFVTGEDDIARFDSWRYTKVHIFPWLEWLKLCIPFTCGVNDHSVHQPVLKLKHFVFKLTFHIGRGIIGDYLETWNSVLLQTDYTERQQRALLALRECTVRHSQCSLSNRVAVLVIKATLLFPNQIPLLEWNISWPCVSGDKGHSKQRMGCVGVTMTKPNQSLYCSSNLIFVSVPHESTARVSVNFFPLLSLILMRLSSLSCNVILPNDEPVTSKTH